MKNRKLPQISIILFLTLLLSLPLTLTQTQAATLKAPKPAVKQINNYLQVSWNKVSGAQGYVIYTKNSKSASWKKVKTVSAGTVKYNYKTVISGKRYYFTVRAYRKTGGKIVYGAYSKTGVNRYYLCNPYLKTCKATYDSITFSWRIVNGATTYQIFRKKNNDSADYIKIGSTTDITYIDNTVDPNTHYRYIIRAYKGNSYSESDFSYKTERIPVNEAIDAKMYEGEDGYSFIVLHNTTNTTYYDINCQIDYFDANGKIVYKEKINSAVLYIKANEIKYNNFKSPEIKYSYYKISLNLADSDTSYWMRAEKAEKMINVTVNNKIVTFTNTTDNVIHVFARIYYLKNGAPISQDRWFFPMIDLNVYQSFNYAITNSDFDDIKVQIHNIEVQ